MKTSQARLASAFALLGLGLPASLSGCNAITQPDTSAPRLLRVLADDPNQVPTPGSPVTHQPVFTPDYPGATPTLASVPITNSTIRIYFSKVLDGSTIQANPGMPDCVAAPNVTVTAKDATGAAVAGFVAQVCWSPSEPAIVVNPAVATCGGPQTGAPWTYLDHGYTYEVIGSGLKDYNGHTIDIDVKVVAATSLSLNAFATGASDYPTGPGVPMPKQAFGPGIAPPAVPSGQVDKTNTYTSATLSTSSSYPSASPAYGAPVLLTFNAPMVAIGSGTPAYLPPSPWTATSGVHVSVGGTDEAMIPVPAGDLSTADPWSIFVAPVYPLEEGATYTVTVDATVTDAGGAHGATATLPAPFVGTFTTTGGGNPLRALWSNPTPGSTTAYVATDGKILGNALLGNAGAGQLGVGIAFSKPIKTNGATPAVPVGTVTVSPAPLVALTPQMADPRGRVIQLVGGAGALPFVNNTAYTVSFSGLEDASAAPFSPPALTFTTLPFEQDPNLPAMWDFSGANVINSTASVAVTTILFDASGSVLGGAISTYAVPLTGPAAAAGAASGTAVPKGALATAPADVAEYHALTAGTVSLAVSGGAAVPGASGEIQFGSPGVEPWLATPPWWPGSIVGITPTAPLNFATSYTLTVAGVQSTAPDGSATAPTVSTTFTTAPFVVIGASASSAAGPGTGPSLASPSNGVASAVIPFDSANPIAVGTSGYVNPAAFAPGAVQLFVLSGGTKTPVPFTLTPFLSDLGNAANGSIGFLVTPAAGATTPGANYALAINPALTDKYYGTPIRSQLYEFYSVAPLSACP